MSRPAPVPRAQGKLSLLLKQGFHLPMGSGDVGQASRASETLQEGKMEFLSHTADSPMAWGACMVHSPQGGEEKNLSVNRGQKQPSRTAP